MDADTNTAANASVVGNAHTADVDTAVVAGCAIPAGETSSDPTLVGECAPANCVGVAGACNDSAAPPPDANATPSAPEELLETIAYVAASSTSPGEKALSVTTSAPKSTSDAVSATNTTSTDIAAEQRAAPAATKRPDSPTEPIPKSPPTTVCRSPPNKPSVSPQGGALPAINMATPASASPTTMKRGREISDGEIDELVLMHQRRCVFEVFASPLLGDEPDRLREQLLVRQANKLNCEAIGTTERSALGNAVVVAADYELEDVSAELEKAEAELQALQDENAYLREVTSRLSLYQNRQQKEMDTIRQMASEIAAFDHLSTKA